MAERDNSLRMRRLPWWALQLLGLACVIVGALLTVRPFHSLVIFTWLLTAGLLLSGVSQLATAATALRPWLARTLGLGWIGAGLLAAFFPGLTIHALTLIVGIILLFGGLFTVAMAWHSGRGARFFHLLRGLANTLFGLLALTAPAATVLVLALLFGLYIIIVGLRQMARAFTMRTLPPGTPLPARPPWSPSWQVAGALGALVVALVGVAVSVNIRQAQPRAPGPFYQVPTPLPNSPNGTILRTEIIENTRTDAILYRVLYHSTGYDGQPTAVSGLIIVPTTPAPATGRKVIAWTHGTVGVAANCAPSLIPEALYTRPLPGLAAFLDAGYVIAATDYQGLGTAGPHPYLVGTSAAMNALDSVRAARNLPAAEAGNAFVVWGESQGGHTALFTGQFAASYAPELQLHGVVASAPAADLTALFKSKTTNPDAVGNLLVAMAVNAWSQVYREAELDQVVLPAARTLVRAIARNCIQNATQIQASIPAATLLNLLFFRSSPLTAEPWQSILRENTPGQLRTAAPILIGQGDDDEVIAPAVQAQFAASLCAAGDTVDYRTYPGVGHLAIALDTANEVAQWVAERFAGLPATTTCH